MVISTHPKPSGSAAAGLYCVFVFLPRACPGLDILYHYVVNFLSFLMNDRATVVIKKTRSQRHAGIKKRNASNSQ
jgi:hypothetical protein